MREGRPLNTHDKSRRTRVASIVVGLWVGLLLSSLGAAPAGAKAMKPLEIKQRYTSVLGALAAGNFEQALADLMELERHAVGDERPWRYVDTLWRSKLQVIRDLLGEPTVDLLMPIIVLHHDAYFLYAEEERIYLAQHSRKMASELAEVYASRSATPAAGSFAGWALTSFASYLWSPSNIGMSAELFYRAHQSDPANRLAMAGMAAAWERSGAYGKAIETLNTALQRQPEDPELALRLALCHLRWADGSQPRALSTLVGLTESPAPAWIRSVAFQELARFRLATDGPGVAEATLRDGLAQLPGDQQLSLQLAAVLESERRRGEAMKVLEEIEVLGWERESARQTYDFWEPPDLAEERADMHRAAQAGLPTLAAALRQASAGGAP